MLSTGIRHARSRAYVFAWSWSFSPRRAKIRYTKSAKRRLSAFGRSETKLRSRGEAQPPCSTRACEESYINQHTLNLKAKRKALRHCDPGKYNLILFDSSSLPFLFNCTMASGENETKTENDEQKATKKASDATGEPNLSRAPSMASTILPTYKSSDEPPPYSEPSSSSKQPAARPTPPQPSSTVPEGSCGMPASMVMGVMGGSAGASSKDSGKSNTRKSFAKTSESDRLASDGRDRTHGRWNVQGTTLSDFGNPFRRFK